MTQQRDQTRQAREFSTQKELNLVDREEQEIFQRISPNAVVIHEVIRLKYQTWRVVRQ